MPCLLIRARVAAAGRYRIPTGALWQYSSDYHFIRASPVQLQFHSPHSRPQEGEPCSISRSTFPDSPPAPRHAAGRAHSQLQPGPELRRVDTPGRVDALDATRPVSDLRLRARNVLHPRAPARRRRTPVAVQACLAEDGPRVVRRVVEISTSGRAPKNDAALFVLAMAAAGQTDAATRCRRAGCAARRWRVPGTHLFHWLQFVKRVPRLGARCAHWRSVDGTRRSRRSDLAYQVLKLSGA